MTGALKFLYNDGGRGLGGIMRFYRGVVPALFQAGPVLHSSQAASAHLGFSALCSAVTAHAAAQRSPPRKHS